MKYIKSLITSAVLLLFVACGTEKKEKNSTTELDKTPVYQDELSELPPDATFEDVRSVLERINGNSDLDTFNKLSRSAGLWSELDSADQILIFAPVNSGFNRVGEAQLTALKTPARSEELSKILKYHVATEQVYDMEGLKSTIRLNDGILRIPTMNGGYIALRVEEDTVILTDETGTDSKIVLPDLRAKNGVVHGISKLLLPQ